MKPSKIKKSSAFQLIDKVGFYSLFSVWALIIILFGTFYLAAATPHSKLEYSSNHSRVESFADAVYFSFVSATTTGFGDIVPTGYFKLVSVLELILGLLLLAIVTSKLVSLKQNFIISELYELSLGEKANSLRSSLLLFRQHINRLLGKAEQSGLGKRDLEDFQAYLSELHETLSEAVLFVKRVKNSFHKGLSPVSAELLVNSVHKSFKKLRDFLNHYPSLSRTEAELLSNSLRLFREITDGLVTSDSKLSEEFGEKSAKAFNAFKPFLRKNAPPG